MLNPSGDGKIKSDKYLRRILERGRWRGAVGRGAPVKFGSYLRRYDIFLYAGHSYGKLLQSDISYNWN